MEKNYQLTKFALEEINVPAVRFRLMIVLGMTEFSVARWIQKNDPNLTRWAVLVVILEITGVSLHTLVEETVLPELKGTRPIKKKFGNDNPLT
jgi:hypothetical protein